MRGGRVFVAVGVVVGVVACTIERAEVRRPPRSTPAVSAEDSANVRGTLLGFAAALERGDLAAMERFLDPRVLVFEAGRVSDGWTTFRDAQVAPMLAALRDLHFAVDVRHVGFLGDAAWVAFHYRIRAESEGGPVAVSGLGTAVLDRRGGVWAIIHLHLSATGEAP